MARLPFKVTEIPEHTVFLLFLYYAIVSLPVPYLIFSHTLILFNFSLFSPVSTSPPFRSYPHHRILLFSFLSHLFSILHLTLSVRSCFSFHVPCSSFLLEPLNARHTYLYMKLSGYNWLATPTRIPEDG